ncbi:hypothetical protein V5O48_009541 [Marasmius crinis-equi]|uniref:UBC core domain-containing protein n=1 Tax=Marasmius crinis-equi TaxID=585013 RepID=A0ABR3FB15_9AGAR
MPPTRAKKAAEDIIEISDSDSEPTADSHPYKRRKVLQDPQSKSMASALATKNENLKGRRRFKADLEDMKEASKTGFDVKDLKAARVQPGDDEGSFEVFVETKTGEAIVSFNVLVSDTADYPKDHNCFAHTMDSDPPSNIQDVIENISTLPARTIAETIEGTLSNLSKAMDTGDAAIDSGNEEDDEVDYDAFLDDDFEDYASSSSKSKIQISRMQHDFIDTVASLYRPGLIRFGHDDFCISVSLSVVKLAESIPPRALMAWDKRLLSRSQHLVLLVSGFGGAYPSPDYTAAAIKTQQSGAAQTPLRFKVGLSGKYKPGTEQAREVHRSFGLITKDAEDDLRAQKEKERQEALAAIYAWDGEGEDPMLTTEIPPLEEPEEEEEEDEERFDRFSMSSSLESLMDQYFLKLVKIRRKHGIGWAGAELVLWEVEKNQIPEEDVVKLRLKAIIAADKEERNFSAVKNLPHDPLAGLDPGEDVNVPLTAFSYLIRRLALCTRYCLVCHSKLQTDYEALKPYVCDSKLCAYQYYSLNKGPSLEYEIIHNPRSVDLLVSLTFVSAAEGVLDDPFPVGIGLQVSTPDVSKTVDPALARGHMSAMAVGFAHPQTQPQPVVAAQADTPLPADGLHDFDQLSQRQMRASIVQLIDTLPSIDDMRKHLLQKHGARKSKPKLVDCDPTVLPAAWQLLRWIIGSCTAYLDEIKDPSERIKNIDPAWRQYRFSVGSPDAEARFKNAVEEAKAVDPNCHNFPSLFVRLILVAPREGFTDAPAVGFPRLSSEELALGVYMAKEGSVSMGSYSSGARTGWRRSKLGPTNCTALVEVVNQPDQFVSQTPYFVVQHTHWLVCRYLLVKTSSGLDPSTSSSNAGQNRTAVPDHDAPYVKLDPKHKITLSSKPIEVPDPTHKLAVLLQARRDEIEQHQDEPDENDREVFEYTENATTEKGKAKEDPYDVDMDFEMADASAADSSSRQPKAQGRPADDWVHDAEYVEQAVSHLMPPPTNASPAATMAVQRELKHMLKEQENCASYKELGWYMPPDLIGDNLFQWIVEMHSFDETLPIAKDLKREGVNSVIFEIRFPPDFPLSPPFFRIITPRFLPFIQGGGGHVTGGGSICMDLLTASGWLPSYSIAAILIQIKLAISNPDPRPARLAGGDSWKRPYQVFEALEGYKRAATTHGWQIGSLGNKADTFLEEYQSNMHFNIRT